MQKRKLDNIQRALSFSPVNISYNPKKVLSGPKNVGYDPFGDRDGDRISNILDCAPLDPTKDGFFRDLGGAVKTRVKGEVGLAKKHLLSRVSGVESRERREKIREAESEGYFEEIKKQVKERGREKARAKFGKREPIGRKLEKTVGIIEEFAQKGRKRNKKRRKVGLVGCPDVSLMLLGSNIRKTKKKTKKKITGTLNVPMPDIKSMV